jgi:hypothetical protein
LHTVLENVLRPVHRFPLNEEPIMDQPDKSASGPPSSQEQQDQQSDATREPLTHVQPPKPESPADRTDDPQRPATDRREGVVSDPDVP